MSAKAAADRFFAAVRLDVLTGEESFDPATVSFDRETTKRATEKKDRAVSAAWRTNNPVQRIATFEAREVTR